MCACGPPVKKTTSAAQWSSFIKSRWVADRGREGGAGEGKGLVGFVRAGGDHPTDEQ
jgi:hypothetical protein